MALKKYKSFIGFKDLEDFYKEPINGIYLEIENFQRSFCNKCGSVTSTLNDVCSCGASKFKRLNICNTWRESIVDAEIISNYNVATDSLDISANVLIFKPNRDDLEVHKEFKNIISFKKNDYIVIDRDYLEIVSKDVSLLKNYKYVEDLLELSAIFNYHGVALKELSIKKAMEIIDFIKEAPNFLLDPDTMRFKHLSNAFIRTFKGYPKKGFRETMVSLNVFEEHFDILNTYCKNNSYHSEYDLFKGYSSIAWSHSKGKTISEFLQEQTFKYKKVPGHMWQTFYHYLESGAIDLNEFTKLFNCYNILFEYDKTHFLTSYHYHPFLDWHSPLRDVKDFCDFWKKDYIKLFPIYFKENLYGKSVIDLVANFVDDLYLMDKYSIPINEDSLKLKNFNYNLNERTLSSHLGLAPEKVEVFLDTFDRNPLASISLLKDRRKLTKKQMDEYMKLLDEET